MNKIDYKEFNKRYNKFKNNNLPTPFFDEERQTIEYVHFDNKEDDENIYLEVNQSLGKALEGIAQTGLYYSFSIKPINGVIHENDILLENGNKHCHAHSFEEVIRELYNFPESFNISEDDEEFYSKQELKYLNSIQKYLLFIGLKDLDNNIEQIPASRYRNRKHSRYCKTTISRTDEKSLQKIMAGELNFKIIPFFPNYSGDRMYNAGEYQMLLVDKDNNFKLHIEFTKREVKFYKDIKEIYTIEEMDDNDEVVVMYFKVLERFEEKN